ncbi:MAG: hypothetical protein AB1523_07275 [Bacillota bacterium]
MPKIKDRMILGVIAGLGGNAAKLLICALLKRAKWVESMGPERAAGMLVSPHRVTQPEGRVVGFLADGVIACMLGIATVYALSIMGKDKAVIKGAIAGKMMWTTLYGMLGNLGATKIEPVSPKTVLSEFLGHTAFGVLTACLAAGLGDPGLFDGRIPLGASSFFISKKEGAING